MSNETKYRVAYPVWLWLLTNAFGAVFTGLWWSITDDYETLSGIGPIIILLLLFGLPVSLPALLGVFLVHIFMIDKTRNTALVRFVLWLVTVTSILVTHLVLGLEFIGDIAVPYMLGLSFAVLFLSPEKKAKRK